MGKIPGRAPLKSSSLQIFYPDGPKPGEAWGVLQQALALNVFALRDNPVLSSGIYFLLLDGDIKYIGQSVCILARVGVHLRDESKLFDSFAFINCHESQLDDLEECLIKLFVPDYNGCTSTKRMRKLIRDTSDRPKLTEELAEPKNYPATMTVVQAAQYLSSTKSTLDKYRLTGGGPPFVKLGDGPSSRVAYRLADLEAWITSRLRKSTSDCA